MRKINFLALLAVSMFCQITFSQTEAEEKAWMDYMTPGPQHKKLAAEEGRWTCTMKFFSDPQSLPLESTTTCVIKMIMDGRYQEITYTGDILGMLFEAKRIVAYDNALKHYTSIYMDNMATGVITMEGTAGNDGKTIIYKGNIVNPVDGKTNPAREVYTIVDSNTRKVEMYDSKDGKEWKSYEIIMKRSN
ncbi:DUF1579 domain-containing protein [Flavobacterium sp. RHBU_3]|uniref:DUF1579 domain-containing protein n=1 Tax=Flavobacterium sp. RHBU_3 TaxID=3391184 RepID=UPI003984FEFF